MEKEIKMVKYSLKKQKQAVRENKTKQNKTPNTKMMMQ